MHPDQLDGELMLAPGFATPPNMDYTGYHNYITDNLPPESPLLYGLHPNAEIGFLTASSEKLFKTVFELQPREGLLKHYWDLVYFFTYFLLVYRYRYPSANVVSRSAVSFYANFWLHKIY